MAAKPTDPEALTILLHQLAAELPGWTAGDILAATEGEAPDARDP